MSVTIRTVQSADSAAVRRLAPRLLVGVDPSRPERWVREAISDWIDDSLASASSGAEDHGCWVAVGGGEVIGFVSVCVDQHWCGQRDAWIGELMVDEQAERQGVGRALVATVEEWATRRGLSRVRLSTGAANREALAFYRRLGYAVNEVTLTRNPRDGT